MESNTEFHQLDRCPLSLHELRVDPVATTTEAGDFRTNQLKIPPPHPSALTKHDLARVWLARWLYRPGARSGDRMTPDGPTIPPENRKWFRLGTAAAVLWAVFVVVLLLLLEMDPTIGLAFAVVGGIVFGVAFTLFVLYVY